MNCSMPGFPALQYLPQFAQTHIHWVSDAIQQSHPLSPPSPLGFNLSQYQGLFQWVSSLHQVAKVLELQLQHQSFQWRIRTDFLSFYSCLTPFAVVQSLLHVRLFATPWTTANRASLSSTISQSLHKLISIESVLPSNTSSSLPPSPTFNPSQHQGLFKWVSSLHQVAKVLELQLQHQSFQWIPRTDLL